MAGKIFISYRRDDSRADSRSVDQRLRTTFGGDRIFFDVDTIQKGKDFRKVLAEALDTSNVLLAMIGPTWLSGVDATGRRRIDDPNDFVRLEIASALKRDIAVIPVLVGGAKMPLEQDLPDDLKALVYRQAAIITHDNFPRDVDGIERDIQTIIGGGKRRAEKGERGKSRVGMAAAAAVFVLLAGGVAALPFLGVPMPWSAKAVVEPAINATNDPVRLAAERAKAEADVKRYADAEEKLRVEAQRKADEIAAQQAAVEAKRQAEAAEQRRKIEAAEAARLEAERQELAVKQAEVNRKRFEAEAADNKRKAQEAEATLKVQEEKMMAEAVDARRSANEQEAARLAVQEKLFAETAEQKRRAEESLAKRKEIEAAALRQAQEENESRTRIFRVGFFADFDQQCRAHPPPKLEVLEKPRYGTWSLKEEEQVLKFVVNKQLQHCVGTKATVRALYFQLNEQDRARTEIEKMSIRIRYAGGRVIVYDFDIDLGRRTATRTKITEQ